MDNGIVIIGSGISGLAANYFLGKISATIYEATNDYGGLCNSFSIGNYTFDNGIHLSFSNSKEVRKQFDKVPYFAYSPEPENYYKGIWMKHPVQNNLFPLSSEEKVKAIMDYLCRQSYDDTDKSYKAWLYSKYGKYISDNFFIPYTKKYWCEKAENMETSWIKERLYDPPLDEILYGAMSEDTPNRYYAKEMRYPAEGGYKSFLKPLALNSNIKYNKKVILIDTDKKILNFEDGSTVNYERLISSIPLPEIINIIKDVPDRVKAAAEKLNHTSLLLVSIGLNSLITNTKSIWFYIYDEVYLPARAHYPHLKSENNVPHGSSSIQFEIYFSKNKPLKYGLDRIKEHVLNMLEELDIACKNNVLFIELKEIKYANVIFDFDLETNRKIIKDYLNHVGILTIGRFGEWDYLWSDQSFLSGKNAADKTNKSILESEK